MSIEIDTHGARIAADDATVKANHLHNIEIKHIGAGPQRRAYVELEVSGGEIELHDLPEDVMAALAAIRDLIHK